jgi:hypothetical protein
MRSLFLVLLALCACGKADKERRQKCFSVKIGMPVADLIKELGQPAERLGGDHVTSWIYGRRSPSDESIDTIAIDEETQKVATVACGTKDIKQYYTPQDADDAKEKEEGEKPDGRQLQAKNDNAIRELKSLVQKWGWKNGGKKPASLLEVVSMSREQALPEVDLPKHGTSRWAKVYGADACSVIGDVPHVDGKQLEDSGQWGYIGEGPCAGHVFIDCTHWSGRYRRWYQFR